MRPTKAQLEAQQTITFDTHGYSLSEGEEQALRAGLESMQPQIDYFPFADFRVVIEGRHRSNEVVVKLSLVLPGTTLVVHDHDATLRPAFERCLDSVQSELHAYKSRLSNDGERKKHVQGTHQELHPTTVIDAEAIERAVDSGDYEAFRTTLLPYEEEVRKLAGRWVQRYPELDAQIDQRIKLADIVEEVFLLAFDNYQRRPANMVLGTWLYELVDAAVKAILRNRDAELENIDLVRSARENSR